MTIKISLVLFCFLSIFISIQASAGDLDPTFGSVGKVVTPTGKFSADYAYATALQPDGKIIAVGRSFDGYFTKFIISRINADGALDTSFGINGVAAKTITSNSYALAVGIQPDGKIVVGGFARGLQQSIASTFTLMRFNSDGSVDNSFGIDGIAQVRFGTANSRITSLAIQPDGKIVAAGFTYANYPDSPGGFAIARLNTEGTIDNTFGNGGTITVNFLLSKATSLIIQPDGKILSGGYQFDGSILQSKLIRLNTNGTFDASFDGDGILTTQIGNSSAIYGLALQTDGKIIAAGTSNNGSNGDFAVARYNSDGSPDTTFNGNGIAITDTDNRFDSATAVSVQADGKIVVGGNSNQDFLSVRYNSDGSLDTSFDGDGKVLTTVTPSEDQANGMIIQPDGKIVLVGYSLTSNYDFALVRYNTNGTLDISFDADGVDLIELGNSTDIILDSAIQPDGRIVAVGYSFDGTYRNVTIARYNINGVLDASFGTDGIVYTSFGNTSSEGRSVVIQPDGKILVGGNINTFTTNSSDFALMRYNSNGSLDTTFGSSGVLTFPIGNSNDALQDIALQNDGKIVAVGIATMDTGNNFAVVRLNSNGTFDSTFGTNGIVLTLIASGNIANSVAIQNDNKIVVGGYGYSFTNSGVDFVLTRYNPDGSLDVSFDGDGKLNTAFSGSSDDVINSIIIQNDGKIVAAGYSDFGFALARYNSDGSLDNTFDQDGKVTTTFNSNYINNQIYDLTIQSDGKILAAGAAVLTGSDFDSIVARYNPNGSLDNSFGNAGAVVTASGDENDEFTSINLQTDGKIVVAGYSSNGLNYDFTLVRFQNDETIALQSTQFDFDGDGKADVSVFRPSSGFWYVNGSTSGFSGTQFGDTNDKLVPADYDGDGKTDVAVFRPSTGTWYLNRSTAGYTGVQFGASTDVPLPADFDGDGKAELVVWRPSTGIWYVYNLSTNSYTGFQFGASTDRPITGDYDGDGKADYAVFRPSNGIWYIQGSTAGFYAVQFGESTDKLVPADYDGDGKTDIAVFRPSTGIWYLNRSQAGFTGFQFGASTDLPTAADYDGDGKADVAVFRPSTGIWYIQQSASGLTGTQFGASTDQPVENVFVP